VIGAKQANLVFDIGRVLEHIREITNGRIVLRYACGAAQQSQLLMHELAQAGFVVQSATRLNSFAKNLADMQIVVAAMDTLVDGHQYNTYVLMTGDRDFTPLVQSLRKRGKIVVGVGMRETTSSSLVELCDSYVFYDDLVKGVDLSHADIEGLLSRTKEQLFQENARVRASVFKQRLIALSQGQFSDTAYPESSFRKFLERYPHIVQIQQEGSTTYVTEPQMDSIVPQLYLRYCTELKKRHLRVVPPRLRLMVLRDLLTILQDNSSLTWRAIMDRLTEKYTAENRTDVSRNLINAVMLLCRQARVIRTLKGRSLSTAPVVLELEAVRPFQQAVILCDRAYLQAILDLSEPFDLTEAAIALYDDPAYASYIQRIARSLNGTGVAEVPSPAALS
jgi:uncharacterized LabA/DUF88 family protein